ncbi:MAG: CotH kinase family protein, partial [Planctomycetota bacterium]
PPDFSGSGGLKWLGDDPKAYARNYQLKSAESPEAWQGLVDLCAVLERTPVDDLERILPQHLDVDATLWFLAVDNALGDDDGYASRASDYLLYRDPKGRFHPIPRDNNEVLLASRGRGGPGGPVGDGPGATRPGAPDGGAPERRGPPPGEPGPSAPDRAAPDGGPPGGGPPGGAGPRGRRGGPGSASTSPLQMESRVDRPLLHRLLEVPTWKQRYLANLHELATTALADEVIAPRLAQWHDLAHPFVANDVHALFGYQAFEQAFAKDDNGKPAPRSMLGIIARRRQVILQDPALQGSWPSLSAPVTTAQLASDGSTQLTVACRADGATIAAVRLHCDRGMFGRFSITEMHDDGKHADGASGDGVYGATLPAVRGGTAWRFWIEAVAADSGHVDCLPAGNGALPFVWKAPVKNGKKK